MHAHTSRVSSSRLSCREVVCLSAPVMTSPSSSKDKIKPHPKPPRRVVAELLPEEVRWFYKKDSADRIWHPMNGSDSLKLEAAYRRHLASSKVTTSTDGSVDDWAKNVVVLDDLYELFYDTTPTSKRPASPSAKSASTESSSQSDEISDAESRTPRTSRYPYRLKPVYWKGSFFLLARGTWFLEASGGNWQPLDGNSPDLARLIEEQHLKMFANQPILSTSPGRLNRVVCELKDAAEQRLPGSGAEVRWYSVNDVLLYNHSQSSRLWRYLNLPSSGTRLMRGYRSKAKVDDGPPPYTDIVFVIHGIGQKVARKKIGMNAAGLREISERLLRKHFIGIKRRPLLLPVDWRTDLGLAEHAVKSITPDCLEQIRALFNEALMDLMYYASPVHGCTITLALCNTLNRMYQTFIAHHPNFESQKGRVCLAAHSLGSVIAHDILTAGTEPLGVDDRVSITSRAVAETCQLSFPVHHLFCLGSPLGIFLVARNVRGRQILKPAGAAPDFRIHNIYHPADPVAYRIEPLVSEVYETVRPLRIHKADASNPKPYESMPNELLVRKPSKKDDTATVSTRASVTSSAGSPTSMATLPSVELELESVSASTSAESIIESVLKTESSKPIATGKPSTIEIPPEDALPYRIDHAVIPGRIFVVYWTAMTTHNSYWSNPDVVMYILSALYGVPKSTNQKSKKKK